MNGNDAKEQAANTAHVHAVEQRITLPALR